jgi:branched-chain amino acid transport system substrate-binding protein
MACLASLLSAAGCTGGPTRILKIGVDLPLSGQEGRAGSPALNGVRFFIQQHPTISGFTVVVDARDDALDGVHDPQQGVRNIQALLKDPLVMAVIGPFDSSVARAEIPIANAASLAMVSPSASSRCLTKDPFLPAGLSPTRVETTCAAAGLPSPKDLRPTGVNNFFRLATTDDLQGPAAADHAYKSLHMRRMAVVSDHEAYGQALASGFTARFAKLGGSVVSSTDYDPATNPDLSAFMQRAKKEGAQAIYFGGVTANHGCAIRAQMAPIFGAGTSAPYLGGDGIAQDPDCIRDAATNADGIYATVPAIDAGNAPGAKSVIAAFKKQYTKASDYGAYTMAAYDAAGVLYEAIGRGLESAEGKRPSRDKIISELGATTSYAGATGNIGFDTAGDSTLRVVSVFESAGSDPRASWTWIAAVDYSTALPY